MFWPSSQEVLARAFPLELWSARWYARQEIVQQKQERGEVEVERRGTSVLRDRYVIGIGDIADEGRTLAAVMELVRSGAPASVRAAVLVSKFGRRRVPLELDYVGFELSDGWVVGHGMDLDGVYRDLDHLAIVEGTDTT